MQTSHGKKEENPSCQTHCIRKVNHQIQASG